MMTSQSGSDLNTVASFITPVDLSMLSGVNGYRKTANLKFKAVKAEHREDFLFIDAQLLAEDGQTVLTEYFEIATCNTLRQARKAARYYEQEGEFTEIKPGFWCRVAWIEDAFFGELITPDSESRVCSSKRDPKKCFETIQSWVDNYSPSPIAA